MVTFSAYICAPCDKCMANDIGCYRIHNVCGISLHCHTQNYIVTVHNFVRVYKYLQFVEWCAGWNEYNQSKCNILIRFAIEICFIINIFREFRHDDPNDLFLHIYLRWLLVPFFRKIKKSLNCLIVKNGDIYISSGKEIRHIETKQKLYFCFEAHCR